MLSATIDDVRQYWNKRPCNIRHSRAEVGTRRYFDEVEQRKYLVEPHIPEFAQFERWRSGEISPAELNDLIHQFHDGPSRDVWRKYATNRLEPALGFAVATGILRKEELPAELLQHLAGLIDFYEAEQSA